MRGYFGLGQLSAAEKQDILNQHKSLYNGYQTMQPQVSNTQPLMVYDFAGDKEGVVVNNKGEVKKYTNFGINEQVEEEEMCEQCGEMEEGAGKLDDIYDVEDLNLSNKFDYVEGQHKGVHKEGDYEDPDNEDDGFEDLQMGDSEMYEQGGNADDMDDDDVAPAYDFESGGPMAGGDVYPVNEYEPMESAWADEEIDEVDVSGSQGIYGDMKPAYDFDSEGPGSAGPYQRFSYNEEDSVDELEIDLDDFDPENKSWEEIKADSSDDWDEIDEDLQESFIHQKNKVMEMMGRMKVIK